MLIVTKEKEPELKTLGFKKFGSGNKRFWEYQIYDNFAIKVIPYSVLGKLNDVSIVKFVPNFNKIDLDSVDCDEQLDAMAWDIEWLESTGIMWLLDKMIHAGILEHTDDVTSFARKSA